MEERPPPWLEPRAAYGHVPFCAHHCGYCDFAVSVGRDDLRTDYVRAIGTELAALDETRPVDTIFLGGGTPTHLEADQLAELLNQFRRWTPLNPGGEFSVETNPESLDAERCDVLAEHGVTRVSVGVQSFQPHVLQALDRRHRYEQIPDALERAANAGLQLSLDLIFGAPGSTLDDWSRDLATALEYPVNHISTYGLTYEKGTPLWKDRERGRLRPATEDLELAMYELAIDTLTAAGFEHYEVSNFAKPGFRCRHNEHYWANHAYFGFGVGAARYVNGSRELNTRNTVEYIRRRNAGESPTFQSECLEPLDRAYETLAVQLRRCEGVESSAFRIQTGFDFETLVGSRLSALADQKLLSKSETGWRLSRTGFCLADAVIEDLLKAKPDGPRRRRLV